MGSEFVEAVLEGSLRGGKESTSEDLGLAEEKTKVGMSVTDRRE